MKNFKKLIREAHLGNPLNEVDRATRVDRIFARDEEYPEFDPEDVLADLAREEDEEINEENEKLDHIARAEYGKSFAMLDDDELKEMLKAMSMNKEYEKEFDTDYTQRRKGDLDDEYDGMTDYQRGRMDEGLKVGDEIVYRGDKPGKIVHIFDKKSFINPEVEYKIDYQDVSGTTSARVRRKDIALKKDLDDMGRKYFGKDYDLEEDINDPALVRARAAKIADEKEKSKQAELDKKYGSNFMDKLDAEIDLKNELQDLKDEREQLMIDMEQEAEPEGGEIADLYGMKLNRIDLRTAEIKPELEDLRMYESVNEDLDIGHQDDEPSMLKSELARAGQMIQMLYRAVDKYDDIEGEVDFPQWWQAKIIKANTLLDSAFDYLAGEEDVAKIDAMIDRIDDDMTEGNGGAEQDDAQLSLNVSSDAALDNEVNKMGYNESLKKSLKEALSKRLSKK